MSAGINMIQTTGPITKRILLLVILGTGCDVRILLCQNMPELTSTAGHPCLCSHCKFILNKVPLELCSLIKNILNVLGKVLYARKGNLRCLVLLCFLIFVTEGVRELEVWCQESDPT